MILLTRTLNHPLQIALAAALGLCLLGACLFNAWAAEGEDLEQRIKVAYLYNFTKFIEWPESSSTGPETPFVLAVIGSDHFNSALKTLKQKRVKGRPLHIVHLDRIKARPLRIDMLFVGLADPEEIETALSAVENQATLTVGDAPAFSDVGGLINFYRADKKIRFEINAQAAHNKGFKLSSQLLKLARIVEEPVP